MISNKKIIKLVDIIYWLVIVITVIIQWVNTVNMGEINLNEIKSATFMQYMQFFIGILFIILFQFVTSILKNFFITIIYFGIKVGYKKYSKEKLEKIDFKYDKYFRDIIPYLFFTTIFSNICLIYRNIVINLFYSFLQIF